VASKAQAAALARIQGKIRKSFGNDASLIPGQGGGRAQVLSAIPSGIDVLDRHLFGYEAKDGTRGLPFGRLVEMYGDTGVGKTTLAYFFAIWAQRLCGVVQWVDSEQSFDVSRFQQLGGDPDSIILTQPRNLEEALGILRIFNQEANLKMRGLSVWDSIATSPTKEETEKGYMEGVSMRRGADIGRGIRDLMELAGKNQTAVLLVNQIREKIGVTFGSPITTPGGKAPKYAASIRLWLMGGSKVEDGEEAIGKDVTFLVEKNRFAPPLRKAKLRLLYATGWDNDWSTFNFAKDRGVIEKGVRFTPAAVEDARRALGWCVVPAETDKSG
jgi:recombination protein RecA